MRTKAVVAVASTLLVAGSAWAAKTPTPVAKPAAVPAPDAPEVYSTIEEPASAAEKAESDATDQEVAREIEIRDVAPEAETPPPAPEAASATDPVAPPAGPAATAIAAPAPSAAPSFDRVEKDQVKSIARRLGLVEKILVKYQRAYDYRLLTNAELEAILKSLETEKKPKKLSRK